MRYPKEFIDELKNQADIVRIIGDYVTLKKKGQNHWACCPFHGEKSPSFSVSAAKGFFKCFGCLEENELIWTDKGLKPIGQVCYCDKVLDLTGKLRPITNIVHKTSDVLLGISTASFRYDPLWLTLDHTCLFVRQADAVANLPYLINTAERLKFKSSSKGTKRIAKYQNKLKLTEGNADQMSVGDYLAFPVISECARKNTPLRADGIIHPKKNLVNGYRIEALPVNEKTARLYGLWLAEGSIGRGYVRWTFAANELTYAEEIVTTLKSEFQLEASIYHHGADKHICEVNCSKTDLAKQLVYWFGKGAAKKKIPGESLYWTTDVQKAFLKGYRDGDANRTGISRSISRELSYGLFAVAIQNKEFISLLRNDEFVDKTGQLHREFWTQYPRKRESLRGFYETIDGTEYYLTQISEIQKKHKVSRVIDISVEGTSSFTTKLATVHNCGKAGTVFQFVMELEGSNFSEAVKTVAEKAGVALPVLTSNDDTKHYEERDKQRDELRQLNIWATEFFENSLDGGEGQIALDYLAKRGISDESRRQFRLGYAPNSWDALSSYLQKSAN